MSKSQEFHNPHTSTTQNQNTSWFPSLHEECLAQDIHGVQSILIKNPNIINSRDENGDTALHIAAANINLALAKTLLEFGAGPLLKNNNGYTPAMVAHVAYKNYCEQADKKEPVDKASTNKSIVESKRNAFLFAVMSDLRQSPVFEDLTNELLSAVAYGTMTLQQVESILADEGELVPASIVNDHEDRVEAWVENARRDSTDKVQQKFINNPQESFASAFINEEVLKKEAGQSGGGNANSATVASSASGSEEKLKPSYLQALINSEGKDKVAAIRK